MTTTEILVGLAAICTIVAFVLVAAREFGILRRPGERFGFVAPPKPPPPSFPSMVKVRISGDDNDGTLHEALAGTLVRPAGWKKVGLLMPRPDSGVRMPLVLFGRFRNRHRNEYMVKLSDDVSIELDNRRYYDLQDGDGVIVPSREIDGEYTVRLYENDELHYNPYIY